MNPRHSFLLTCEHAGNQLPRKYAYLFEGNESILSTHEGWDPGAWSIAQHLASVLNVPLFSCHVSRLLIEVNRSVHHPKLFSVFSHPLSDNEKEDLIEAIYRAYRSPVEKAIGAASNPVAHFSIHSFTPVLDGQIREMDIGVLFDPERKREAVLSQRIREQIQALAPGLNVVFNEPYKGTDDGFTTYLRSIYPDERYTGIELEINQKHTDTESGKSLIHTLSDVLLHI